MHMAIRKLCKVYKTTRTDQDGVYSVQIDAQIDQKIV